MKTIIRYGLICLMITTCFIQCKKTETIVEQSVPNFADSVKRNLWGHYTFNGSMADSSGKNHQMAGMNGIAFGNDRSGASLNALLLDGVNDFAVIDSGKVFPEGAFTVSFWMNPQNPLNGRIFNKADFNTGASPTINFGFDDVNATSKLNFSISKDNNVCGNFWSPASATLLVGNVVISPNNWYHVAAQHVNGVEKIYLNGQLIAATTTPNVSFKACSNAPWYFGIWWTGGMLPYKGSLDNIRIYNRALTDQEVKWLNDNYK